MLRDWNTKHEGCWEKNRFHLFLKKIKRNKCEEKDTEIQHETLLRGLQNKYSEPKLHLRPMSLFGSWLSLIGRADYAQVTLPPAPECQNQRKVELSLIGQALITLTLSLIGSWLSLYGFDWAYTVRFQSWLRSGRADYAQASPELNRPVVFYFKKVLKSIVNYNTLLRWADYAQVSALITLSSEGLGRPAGRPVY